MGCLTNIVLLSVIEIFADFTLRFYAQTGEKSWLIQGCLGYVGVVYFLIQSLRGNNVLYVNGMWDTVSAVLESAAAFIFLGDRLKNKTQYIGLAMGIIGGLLLRSG